MSDKNNSGTSESKGGSTSMTKGDSSRVQSTQALGGGNMSAGGFAARAQSAGDRNANAGAGGNNTGSAKK